MSDLRVRLETQLKTRYTGEVSHTRREAWNEVLDLLASTPAPVSPEPASNDRWLEQLVSDLGDNFLRQKKQFGVDLSEIRGVVMHALAARPISLEAAVQAGLDSAADECEGAQRDHWEAKLTPVEAMKWNTWVVALGDSIRSLSAAEIAKGLEPK